MPSILNPHLFQSKGLATGPTHPIELSLILLGAILGMVDMIGPSSRSQTWNHLADLAPTIGLTGKSKCQRHRFEAKVPLVSVRSTARGVASVQKDDQVTDLWPEDADFNANCEKLSHATKLQVGKCQVKK